MNQAVVAFLAPRFFLGRTPEANLWRFRDDLPEELVKKLEALCFDEPSFDEPSLDEPISKDWQSRPRHFDAYMKLLESHAPVQNIWAGPVYHFTKLPEPLQAFVTITEANPELLQRGFETLMEELPQWQPFVAILEDNRAVSVCRSVRITPQAHEAGLETLLKFRRRGYAKDVVIAWARAVQAIGATPLYSTSWENTASQAVARKLKA